MNDPKIAQCERQSDSSSSGRKARQRADVSSSYKDVQINWRINSKSECPIDLEEGKGKGGGERLLLHLAGIGRSTCID